MPYIIAPNLHYRAINYKYEIKIMINNGQKRE
jgi:hypothetical protein